MRRVDKSQCAALKQAGSTTSKGHPASASISRGAIVAEANTVPTGVRGEALDGATGIDTAMIVVAAEVEEDVVVTAGVGEEAPGVRWGRKFGHSRGHWSHRS